MTVRRPSEVPAEIVAALNAGERCSQTLAEFLAIDFRALLAVSVPALKPHLDSIDWNQGVSKKMAAIGELIAIHLNDRQLNQLSTHPSDSVRSWIPYAIARRMDSNVNKLLEHVRLFADDTHSGVREWAWIAVRPAIARELEPALEYLANWSLDDSANIRRFASESTRPCGVWCAHIGQLKEEPELGRSILEPLRSDPARYVQNSVGNWLNDAGKSKPAWVRSLCSRWKKESNTPATQRIIRRATRNLIKK